MNRNIIYLKSILDSISEIEGFDTSLQKRNDVLVERAVEKCIENIGEAANRITKEIKLKYSFIPWVDIISFRNRLSHDYFGYDRKFLWLVVDMHLSNLKDNITKILNEIEG